MYEGFSMFDYQRVQDKLPKQPQTDILFTRHLDSMHPTLKIPENPGLAKWDVQILRCRLTPEFLVISAGGVTQRPDLTNARTNHRPAIIYHSSVS